MSAFGRIEALREVLEPGVEALREADVA